MQRREKVSLFDETWFWLIADSSVCTPLVEGEHIQSGTQNAMKKQSEQIICPANFRSPRLSVLRVTRVDERISLGMERSCS